MLENYVVWIILGLVLVIVELTTGTFYLLVLGIAAIAGSLAAYLGGSFAIQAMLASGVGVAGVFLVNRWRRNYKGAPKGTNIMDVGQPVIFESWTDEAARMGRVKYRGASWDAHLIGNTAAQANDVLYICGTEGSQLQVSFSKPV